MLNNSADQSGFDMFLEGLSEDQFIALVDEYGGQRLYVPHKIRDSHRVAKAIGPKAAAFLSSHFAACTVRVPLARERRVHYLRSKGLSKPAIAKRLVMTESGVSAVLKKPYSKRTLRGTVAAMVANGSSQ